MSLWFKREMAAREAMKEIGGASIFNDMSNQRLVELHEMTEKDLRKERRRVIKTENSKERHKYLANLQAAIEYECGRRTK